MPIRLVVVRPVEGPAETPSLEFGPRRNAGAGTAVFIGESEPTSPIAVYIEGDFVTGKEQLLIALNVRVRSISKICECEVVGAISVVSHLDSRYPSRDALSPELEHRLSVLKGHFKLGSRRDRHLSSSLDLTGQLLDLKAEFPSLLHVSDNEPQKRQRREDTGEEVAHLVWLKRQYFGDVVQRVATGECQVGDRAEAPYKKWSPAWVSCRAAAGTRFVFVRHL